jgi:hypothetical protein
MNKWVEHNKKEFGCRLIELKRIISNQVKDGGKADTFTSDMLVAIVSGRKITEKMQGAIDNIIKQNSPEETFKRDEWLASVLPKLLMVENMIKDTDWTNGYKGGLLYFMESIIKQAKNRKTLSKKQMEAVSKMYARIKKNIEKNKNKA